MAFLVGFGFVALTILSSIYTLDKAREATRVEVEDARRQAALGYEILADPIQKLEDAARNLDWRASKLEKSCLPRPSTESASPDAGEEPQFPETLPVPPADLERAAAAAAAAEGRR